MVEMVLGTYFMPHFIQIALISCEKQQDFDWPYLHSKFDLKKS